ncbi:TPA: PaREP1/PaREP8 domain-contain protein, partial [Candidatus Bathyarchaeota archaeon]|nr:PaREP1/PaREP8 domain-contain protein [Candidatus Bathyarchaeota archaeon]
LTQASEKFWGAVAESIKAVAESRGWERAKHGHLMETVSRLFEETGDKELPRLTASAERLHSNFYEDPCP